MKNPNQNLLLLTQIDYLQQALVLMKRRWQAAQDSSKQSAQKAEQIRWRLLWCLLMSAALNAALIIAFFAC